HSTMVADYAPFGRSDHDRELKVVIRIFSHRVSSEIRADSVSSDRKSQTLQGRARLAGVQLNLEVHYE
ncbi:MAG: hypothetical protein KGH97_03190, partial [Patescibacteria group bacterium]|nr:hypothetical protein [Patescibacteria group bacterium]